jgi:hypothetical protein
MVPIFIGRGTPSPDRAGRSQRSGKVAAAGVLLREAAIELIVSPWESSGARDDKTM